jgi:YVTN family beta-propeller protein
MKRTCLWALAAILPLSAASVRIYQTNSAGDDASVIDPATNKVVLHIPDLEVAHGVAFAPDGGRAYFTVESDSTVKAIDTKTGKLLGSVKLSGHPNNLSVSKDGHYVFAGIAVAPGAVDVVDTTTMSRVKSIPVKGAVHNVYTTPDGRYVVSGSVAGSMITVIDAKTLEPAWELKMDAGIRPMTFGKAADGSTDRIFVQLSNFHGFAVVDFHTHEVVNRVKLPDEPKNGSAQAAAPAHGIGVTPDGKHLVSNSSVAQGVFIYSMPDLKLEGFVKTGNTPDWLTFTPDSKTVYVANSGANNVTAVDLAMRKVVATIPVGESPKRNGTVVVP